MELSVVSEEYIEPSSPTPHHRRTHLLSSWDQVISPHHIRITLFYPVGVDTVITSEIHTGDVFKKRLGLLKQSLSKTLSSFYPLAGKVKDEISVDCNDQGVYFVEANVNSNLSEVLQRSDCFHKLLPGGVETESSSTNDIAMVQVKGFQCGGIAISVSISHRIIDASSISFFLRSWAACSKAGGEDGDGAYQLACPDFDASTRLTKPEATPDATAIPPFIKTGTSASTKRFRFDAEAVAALKAKSWSSRSCKTKMASRVEAVSAILCKSIAAAMKARSGQEKPICTTHLVDVRRRAMPPCPDSFMGNYVSSTSASLGVVDERTEFSDLVIKLREAITKTCYSNFVKCSESETAEEKDLVAAGATPAASNLEADHEYIAFNSWCNVGFYEVDFGWGKPVWITTTHSMANFGNTYINTVFLMDTRSRDGVEAWITLDEEEMALLEQDKELLTFAALDPNPLTA